MKKYKAIITVRGWVEGTTEDRDKNVSVPRCTKTIHHIFTATSKTDAKITLKWFLNHPKTKYHFGYHTIMKVVLSELISEVPEGTTLASVVKDQPLKHTRGTGVTFNRDKLYTEESHAVSAPSDNYVVVSWGKHSVEISKSSSPGDQMSYRVPIDSLIVNCDGVAQEPEWSSLSPTELMYIAFKEEPVFHDAGVEVAVS